MRSRIVIDASSARASKAPTQRPNAIDTLHHISSLPSLPLGDCWEVHSRTSLPTPQLDNVLRLSHSFARLSISYIAYGRVAAMAKRKHNRRMGRPPLGLKATMVRLRIGTQARIDVVLRKGETRSAFIGAAIDAALKKRKPRRG